MVIICDIVENIVGKRENGYPYFLLSVQGFQKVISQDCVEKLNQLYHVLVRD